MTLREKNQSGESVQIWEEKMYEINKKTATGERI